MTIHKYALDIIEHQVVMMPPLPRILKVEMLHNQLYVWAVVDDEYEATEAVDFWLVGTHQPLPAMPCDAAYENTIFENMGEGITCEWHVYAGPCYD